MSEIEKKERGTQLLSNYVLAFVVIYVLNTSVLGTTDIVERSVDQTAPRTPETVLTALVVCNIYLGTLNLYDFSSITARG